MIHPHDALAAEVMALWESGGLPKGAHPGWPSLAKHYTVGTAQMTVVTGTPGAGKSEFMDALMVNLAKRGDWRFIIYSPENAPISTHHAKIIEKYTHKPFNPGPTLRLDKEELDTALDWMKGKFIFAKPKQLDLVSLLDVANRFTDELGGGDKKTGVVLDPWNMIEHARPQYQSETDYIGEMLTVALNWVRTRNAHIWIVAHPQKMLRDKAGKYPVPTPYDINGSAHWFNRPDACLCVWRDRGSDDPKVEIHVQKIRFKHIGHEGMTNLIYNRVTGEYSEPAPSMVPEKWEKKHGD